MDSFGCVFNSTDQNEVFQFTLQQQQYIQCLNAPIGFKVDDLDVNFVIQFIAPRNVLLSTDSVILDVNGVDVSIGLNMQGDYQSEINFCSNILVALNTLVGSIGAFDYSIQAAQFQKLFMIQCSNPLVRSIRSESQRVQYVFGMNDNSRYLFNSTNPTIDMTGVSMHYAKFDKKMYIDKHKQLSVYAQQSSETNFVTTKAIINNQGTNIGIQSDARTNLFKGPYVYGSGQIVSINTQRLTLKPTTLFQGLKLQYEDENQQPIDLEGTDFYIQVAIVPNFARQQNIKITQQEAWQAKQDAASRHELAKQQQAQHKTQAAQQQIQIAQLQATQHQTQLQEQTNAGLQRLEAVSQANYQQDYQQWQEQLARERLSQQPIPDTPEQVIRDRENSTVGILAQSELNQAQLRQAEIQADEDNASVQPQAIQPFDLDTLIQGDQELQAELQAQIKAERRRFGNNPPEPDYRHMAQEDIDREHAEAFYQAQEDRAKEQQLKRLMQRYNEGKKLSTTQLRFIQTNADKPETRELAKQEIDQRKRGYEFMMPKPK